MSASVDLPDTGTGKSLRFEGKKGVTVMIQTVPLFGCTCLSAKRPEKLECTKLLGNRSSPLTKYMY